MKATTSKFRGVYFSPYEEEDEIDDDPFDINSPEVIDNIPLPVLYREHFEAEDAALDDLFDSVRDAQVFEDIQKGIPLEVVVLRMYDSFIKRNDEQTPEDMEITFESAKLDQFSDTNSDLGSNASSATPTLALTPSNLENISLGDRYHTLLKQFSDRYNFLEQFKDIIYDKKSYLPHKKNPPHLQSLNSLVEEIKIFLLENRPAKTFFVEDFFIEKMVVHNEKDPEELEKDIKHLTGKFTQLEVLIEKATKLDLDLEEFKRNKRSVNAMQP